MANTKFYHGQQVKVIKGFHRHRTGVIRSYWRLWFCKPVYQVWMDGSTYWIDFRENHLAEGK